MEILKAAGRSKDHMIYRYQVGLEEESMYKCVECGHVFSEPYLYQEPHGEVTECCPRCMGWGFQAARRCGRCGNWHLKEDLPGGTCRACLAESIRKRRKEAALRWGENLYRLGCLQTETEKQFWLM